MRPFAAALYLLSLSAALPAAAQDEIFRVYTEHPRLFLRPQRLRLLKREHERQSMRWEQLNRLLRGGLDMPEPGFVWALDYQVTGDAAAAKKAVEWALGATGATDLRQLALVFDWCQDALTAPQRASLAAKIRSLLAQPPRIATLPVWRGRILAAIAIAETDPEFTETLLREAVTQWWRKDFAPELGTPAAYIDGGDVFPLAEILHAVRDNLNIDLREARIEWFEKLPAYHVASHYPAPYPAAENEYRIPAFIGKGEPDLNGAALSRAAGFALVAYDNNATPSQFLQGWLIQDRFLLRGAFGSPYEFLWANPYQPGLSYMHLPLVFHDNSTGALFIRATWEENSPWFGVVAGQRQLFHDGAVTVLNGKLQRVDPFDLGPAAVVFASGGATFPAGHQSIFVVGLKPGAAYEVETDDEEMRELRTDIGGTLEIKFPKARDARVRIRRSSAIGELEEATHESR